MKTSLIIISTLLVLSVFVPFLLFIFNGTKQTSKIKKQVKALTKNNGFNYKHQEIWRKNFIGISDKDSLAYIHFKDDKPFTVETKLSEIESSQIIKEHASSKNGKSHLKRLGIELNFKQRTKPNEFLEFFDVDKDVSEDFEIQRIEKWHSLIKQAISTNESLLIKKAS